MSRITNTFTELRRHPALMAFFVVLLIVELAVTVFFWNFASWAGILWLTLFLLGDALILAIVCAVFSR